MHNEQHEILSQPPSIRVFFATEMWERYGFYVVQSLLALYLALFFKWPDEEIYALVSSVTALSYLTSAIGGFIADHFLGQKRAILSGIVVLFISYLILTLTTNDKNLAIALAGVVVGTGLLKPNISSLLGNEYPAGSAKRERGFTIFYIGITTGIILGTTLPSILSNHFGWSFAFISAAIGMIISFAVFAFGAHYYKIADYHPSKLTITKVCKALLFTFALWLMSYYILNKPAFANTAFISIFVLSTAYLIYSIKGESQDQTKQTIVIGLLCIISIMFWAFYFQMFMSLTLFISRVVEPTLFGLYFPPPYYVTIQSLGMVVFGYLLSRSKNRLTAAQFGIRTGNKFMLAMCCTCLAYLLITVICYGSKYSSALLFPLLFIPTYLLLAVAELLLSPVGLSAITVLASRNKVSTMMGMFLVSLGMGGYLAGKLASLTSVDATHMSIIELKIHYAHSFATLFCILLIATAMCFILNLIVKKLLSDQSMESARKPRFRSFFLRVSDL